MRGAESADVRIREGGERGARVGSETEGGCFGG